MINGDKFQEVTPAEYEAYFGILMEKQQLIYGREM